MTDNNEGGGDDIYCIPICGNLGKGCCGLAEIVTIIQSKKHTLQICKQDNPCELITYHDQLDMKKHIGYAINGYYPYRCI
jgi:hypothetical protein